MNEESAPENRPRFRQVGIRARCDMYGHVVPSRIDFEDERGKPLKFRITRVVREELAESRKSPIPEAGGIRYTVIFAGKTHILYRVGDKNWFLSLTETC